MSEKQTVLALPQDHERKRAVGIALGGELITLTI